jgi:hypothetical protein
VITHEPKLPDPIRVFLGKTLAGGLIALALCFAQSRYFDWRDRYASEAIDESFCCIVFFYIL